MNIHVTPGVKAALKAWADHERRSLSAQCGLILEDACPAEFYEAKPDEGPRL